MNNNFLKVQTWYRLNFRNLPWRISNDAYKIWLSEIILQQTRVDQGLPYYHKFLDNFPTIVDLANADEEKVLKLWQGLGYYSRARNLHTTAKMVRDQYNGVFPQTYSEILKLKGVGEYTAAAIASFAYDLPHAVVDGNVYRVLSRLYDIDTPIDSTEGKKIFRNLAQEVLSLENPALHNQAIMEFGALQCVPVNPNCDVCPVREFCMAYSNKTIANRPVKANKTKVQNRYFYYMVYATDDEMILKQRLNKDIWLKMYDFPLIETPEELKETDFEQALNTPLHAVVKITRKKHILSHQHIYATFLELNQLPKKTDWKPDWRKFSFNEVKELPLPRIIDKYLEEEFEFLEG
ncbi:MAG TPA: A/G-specific adenine glycosylase [Crocinitomicaceae bacterium]|nr:A/G-specific adenine glycosylase [Crocinitomicaceae bacterium]